VNQFFFLYYSFNFDLNYFKTSIYIQKLPITVYEYIVQTISFIKVEQIEKKQFWRKTNVIKYFLHHRACFINVKKNILTYRECDY
jgi:hypothetical protein